MAIEGRVGCGCRRRASRSRRAEIAAIRAWIDAGARRRPTRPRGRPAASTGRSARPSGPRCRGASNDAWVRNPIDAFLAAGHERRGLTPVPEADRATLLRRVYLDLIGLAPDARGDREAFLADPSPGAYEQVVDRLLASPQYGERWGRHWMDVWRYSDWDGYGDEVRESQPQIWRWRDWIVESLNEDKGYDRMIVEMLAADEARARRSNDAPGHRIPRPQLVQVQPQHLAPETRSSTPPRRSSA